jgi:hypothetical protein
MVLGDHINCTKNERIVGDLFCLEEINYFRKGSKFSIEKLVVFVS